MNHLRVFDLGDLADLPPHEALLRLCQGERPFLLDGTADADGLGRWSYGGCDPVARHRDSVMEPPPASGWTPGRRPPALPLHRLRDVLRSWAPLAGVGVLGYDVGRAIERLPEGGPDDDLGVPPIDVAGHDAIYRYDRLHRRADILAVDGDAARRLRRRLHGPPCSLPPPAIGPARFEIGDADYRRKVTQVQEYLLAGDCYQVNLCRWLRAACPAAAALPLYLRLRQVAPAPLGAFLQLDPVPGTAGAGPVLLSNTPELLLRADFNTGHVETRPIKGTRRRDADPARDRALAEELLASDKDHAEHLMIVDLLRNDLGRVAATGSVAVHGYARHLPLPTVHHLVSTVAARLSPGADLADLLTAVLPGGSITGAPKLRAMEIIDELEPHRRGPFYGAIGWLTPEAADLALCIRTALLRGDELILAVGGGIVVDSTPQGELDETVQKAAAFVRVLS